MTPKFDNLASLLMEMSTPRIPDEKKLEIAEYIEQFPEDSYEDIAAAFGVTSRTVQRVAGELEVQRGSGWHGAQRKGKETHHMRKLTDKREKQVLDYWLANHHEMTLSELARWVRQQFNIVTGIATMVDMLKRAAAKQVPPVQLPPPDRGKGSRLKKQRSQHRNEPGTGKLPTQGSQYFDPGTTINPPKPPGE
jgi:transposase